MPGSLRPDEFWARGGPNLVKTFKSTSQPPFIPSSCLLKKQDAPNQKPFQNSPNLLPFFSLALGISSVSSSEDPLFPVDLVRNIYQLSQCCEVDLGD